MKYVSVDDLHAYCDNQKDHSITPNDFQRMNHIDIPDDIEDFSDGYHTFNELYFQRLVLFAVIVNTNKHKAWKTKYHEDGEPCFGGGWFLVTIQTPEGDYGYHYEEKYWNMFDCKVLKKARHWDGYTDKDVGRLLSLISRQL